MAIALKTTAKSSGRFWKYNLRWEPYVHPWHMELEMIRHGGRWTKANGETAGEGLFFHFRRFQELAWPDKLWRKGPFVNHWAEKCLEVYLDHTYIGVMGCAGCVRGDTRILNPINGRNPTIADLFETQTRPVVMTALGPVLASVPFIKGVDDLYEVTTRSGRRFSATLDHLVLLTTGVFCPVGKLQSGHSILIAEPAPAGSTWEHVPSTHALDGLRFWQKEPDFQYDYQTCSYSYGAQLHRETVGVLGNQTSPTGAQERMSFSASSHSDARGSTLEHTRPYPSDYPLSTDGFSGPSVRLETSGQPHSFLGTDGHGVHPLPPGDIFLLLNNLRNSISEPALDFARRQNALASYPRLWVARDVVTSIKFVGREYFYDIQVPDANHYYAEGFLHHNSGKSDSFGSNALTDWYALPECTTVLVSSTDLKSLELRIWGMIKKYHKAAKKENDWIPGHLIEGKQMLILDDRTEAADGRDFKNGIIAVAAKRGNQFVGLGPLVGIHNKRVRVVGDEMNLMPRALLDSISNLSKCEDFKMVGLGNPNETTNAHGVLCEPSRALGGWEAALDQQPGTKIWETNFPNGIALQLPGSDTPNRHAPEGEPPPFPFLITPQQLKDDAQIWGADDWHYTMMDEARMPRGQGSRRVLTRQMCDKFDAFKVPAWRDSRRTHIAFLDAAYRGVGGDRCVFGELQFGPEAEGGDGVIGMNALLVQSQPLPTSRQIIALVDLMVIPLSGDTTADSPEDQIVAFVKGQCLNRGIPPENFFFDAGMRTSLVTAFSRIWTPMINSVDCGGKPSEHNVSSDIQKPCREYYSKFITELWFSVRLIVESSQFRGMTEEACTEFSQREWKVVAGNKIEVESKEEMKEKTGHSPDLADAIAVGCYGARMRGLVIKRAIPPDRAKPGKDWRDDVRKKAAELHRSGSLNYA